VLVAVAVYCLAGEYTTSPALGSAPIIFAKISYGLVIPSVLSKGLAFGHTGIKYTYVELMKYLGLSHELSRHNTRSWLIWLGIVTVFWLLSFVLSIAVPVFDSILSITSAATIAWFSFGISAIFSLHRTLQRGDDWRTSHRTPFNILLIVGSLFLNGAGIWSSTMGLKQALASLDG
ncbi:neutral amino acid permease, partial [Fusarium albosuccineum]